MNLSDLYAICCLLLWSVSLGIVVAMLCMGRNKNAEKSGVSFNIAAIAWIVSILRPVMVALKHGKFKWFPYGSEPPKRIRMCIRLAALTLNTRQ